MRELVEQIVDRAMEGTHLFPVNISVSGRKIDIQVDGDAGVNIEECARISRHLSRSLEEQGYDPGDFAIEVSSPGLSRHLESSREFKKNVGRKLQFRDPGNKYQKGLLVYVSDTEIGLQANSRTAQIDWYPLSDVREAKVVI